ncbi:MAG: BadF/BadG/BcrA/BcrD ATPase family protein [Propionibacteriaceae bacterium]|nr:BadF/BadG/BcrA/BcrD ATPase family protein [Propionibacteriaceae bacterium]
MSIALLALDGGQSGMRTLLDGPDGNRPGPEFTGIRSDQPLLTQLRDIVLATLDGRRADVLAMGLSGLGASDSARLMKDLLGDAVGTVLLAHDSTTSYLGALGPREGVVVASGTGAVTLAVGPDTVRRVDGWGHLLGDAGSGFWIGREALSAVLRALDGRGVPTALTEHAEAEFGDLSQLYLQLQADPARVSRIASWARRVSELARTDEVCAQISRSAGRQLAESAATGLTSVSAENVASTVGNVFLNDLVSSSFVEHLTELIPDVQVLSAAGTGLDGAATLVRVTSGSALGALVDRAQ